MSGFIEFAFGVILLAFGVILLGFGIGFCYAVYFLIKMGNEVVRDEMENK